MRKKALRRDFPFPSPDPNAFLHELTRRNSDSTITSSGDHPAATILEKTTGWTDEKHNLYLNLLEASFVKQLHHSISSGGWLSQEKIQGSCLFPHMSTSKHGNSTEQFVVHQEVHLKPMKLQSYELPLDSTADSQDVLERSWTCHFTSAGMCRFATFLDSQEIVVHSVGISHRNTMNLFCEPASSSEKHPVCHPYDQSLGGSTTEVSDQNFVDEDRQGKISHETMGEIPKSAVCDSSNSDQAVQFGKVDSAADSGDSDTYLRRGKKRLLSDCPESLASPNKSDMPYYLRGS